MNKITSYLVSEGGFQYILDLPSSHHQYDITSLIGNPELKLYLEP